MNMPCSKKAITDAVAESGLIVFKFIEGNLSHSNVFLEVVIDDHLFPSYTSMKIKSKTATFEDGELFCTTKDW